MEGIGEFVPYIIGFALIAIVGVIGWSWWKNRGKNKIPVLYVTATGALKDLEMQVAASLLIRQEKGEAGGWLMLPSARKWLGDTKRQAAIVDERSLVPYTWGTGRNRADDVKWALSYIKAVAQENFRQKWHSAPQDIQQSEMAALLRTSLLGALFLALIALLATFAVNAMG